MKKQIVVIHGGSAFDTYEEFLQYLGGKEVTLEKLKAKGWKQYLGEVLGNEYDVLTPQMPNSQNAKYLEWKIWFEKIIPLLDESVVLIGHSLGGIFIVKYLSENIFPKKIKATFLVGTPYTTKDDHPLADFIISNDLNSLEKQAGKIFIYHSKDDKVVKYKNCEAFQKSLPNAFIRTFENRGHFNDETFPEIVEDIKKVS